MQCGFRLLLSPGGVTQDMKETGFVVGPIEAGGRRGRHAGRQQRGKTFLWSGEHPDGGGVAAQRISMVGDGDRDPAGMFGDGADDGGQIEAAR